MLCSPRTQHSRSRSPARVLSPLAGGVALLLGVVLAVPANAALSDTLHPFASVVYSHEDNLLRLPDDTPGFAGPRSDNLRQAVVGVSLERPISRQLLTAEAKVSRVSFDHYQALDYNGKDLSAAWKWHLFDKLDGTIGASYGETLTPFTDFHSSERNLRTSRGEYANANWLFLPSWQVHAGFIRNKFSYDLTSQRGNDRTEDAADAGIDFLASSGSRVGLLGRHLKGRYTNPLNVGNFVVDNGYTQDEVKANIYWHFSGTTQVQALAGWAKRKHANSDNRNSSGANGRVTVFWQPLGKLRFVAAGWREFAAVESTVLSNSLNKGGSLNATWAAAAKVSVDAGLRRESRDFSAANGIQLPGDASDSIRRASLGLTYVPQQFLQLGVSAFQEKRTGNALIGSGSYRANGMSVTATAQF